MSFDPEAHRTASVEGWEEAAAGWVRRERSIREWSAPVAQWMLDAVNLQPGEQVLELAAGTGETALLAAELVAPGGHVIVSDQAEAMLDGARARAAELGLTNVEFKVLNAEWIDLPLASVDVVLCRWGYMLMADPGTALRETRRVLRPSGRLALAVWDSVEANPWALLPAQELRDRGLAPANPAPEPGPFALSAPGQIKELMEEAGFAGVTVDAIDLPRRPSGFDELWETTLDLSRRFHDTVMSRPQEELDSIRASLQERFAVYAQDDGSLLIPARTLVASAVG